MKASKEYELVEIEQKDKEKEGGDPKSGGSSAKVRG